MATPTTVGVLSSYRVKAILVVALLGLLAGCKEELGPLNEPSGFSGVIRFRNWPPASSIYEMRLVALEFAPTDSLSIISSLLAGKAAVYPPAQETIYQRWSTASLMRSPTGQERTFRYSNTSMWRSGINMDPTSFTIGDPLGYTLPVPH